MTDPTNAKWSKDSSRIGHSLLRKQGWSEGEGLGREGQGEVDHVKVRHKSDNMGIGYNAQVSQTWSAASVGLCSVLDRLNGKAEEEGDDDEPTGSKSKRVLIMNDSSDSDEGETETAAPLGSKRGRGAGDDDSDAEEAPKRSGATGYSGGKHSATYGKRQKLKTGALFDTAGKEEIVLRKAKDPRADTGVAANVKMGEGTASSLRSPMLKRMMVRAVDHEPRATAEIAESDVRFVIPDPKPPKCKVNPFNLE